MTDLDARCFFKRAGTLVPADIAADEWLADVKENRQVLLTVRRARSPKQHGWFFALLRKVRLQHPGRWHDEQELLDDLKIATGHVTRRKHLLTGEVCLVAQSISLASMTDAAFQRFRDRCLYVLERALGVSVAELMPSQEDRR